MGEDCVADRRFALLSYQKTDNIGDEVQSLAAKQYLPRVDYFVNRDGIVEFEPDRKDEKIYAILNGWFCFFVEKFGFSDALTPLLLSMHIAAEARKRFAREDIVEYMRRHGPVGARDISTLTFLRSIGVESYFSGCLTMTLPRPEVERQSFVVANDIPNDAGHHIQRISARDLVSARHAGFADVSPYNRMRRAQDLLNLYASAHSVVTSRLHCALPCLAMGTPVLLLGREDEIRYSGLKDFVNFTSLDKFMKGETDWHPDRPKPNPTKHHAFQHDLRRKATNFIAGF